MENLKSAFIWLYKTAISELASICTIEAGFENAPNVYQNIVNSDIFEGTPFSLLPYVYKWEIEDPEFKNLTIQPSNFKKFEHYEISYEGETRLFKIYIQQSYFINTLRMSRYDIHQRLNKLYKSHIEAS